MDEEEEMANIAPDMIEGGDQCAFSAPTQGDTEDTGRNGVVPVFNFSG